MFLNCYVNPVVCKRVKTSLIVYGKKEKKRKDVDLSLHRSKMKEEDMKDVEWDRMSEVTTKTKQNKTIERTIVGI